jgi:hypothetical protein
MKVVTGFSSNEKHLEIDVAEGITVISNSPYGHCCRCLIDTSAEGYPPQRTVWGDAGTTTLLQLSCSAWSYFEIFCIRNSGMSHCSHLL